MSGNAVERNISADKRLDTFIQTDFAKGTTVPPGAQTVRGSWEMAVPSGNYQVTVSVGDPGPDLSSSYRINIEGITVLAGVRPTSTNHFASATIVVAVSDGRLTIDTRNGRNTKINYVTVKTITDTTPPAAPGGVVANPGNALVTLNWNANTEPDLRGYDVYRGTSGSVSTAGTPLNGATPLTTTTFSDSTVTNGTTYYYVVVASDTTGNRSPPSAMVSATPSGGSTPPPTNRQINFQPAGAPIPSGWTADTGAAFSAATGQGWVREDSVGGSPVPLDVSANARDRNFITDQTLDTFIHMQYPPLNAPAGAVTTPAAWELAVPNGGYTVTVAVGDAGANFDSTHRIRIEGAVAIAGFVPTSATHFAQATLTPVTVADGRLTVDASGGTNTKIDFLTIATAAT